MIYIGKINGVTFFNTAVYSEQWALTSAVITNVAGQYSSFEFTVPVTHNMYGEFHPLTDYITVTRGSRTVFSGRILSLEYLMDMQLKVTCEGMLGILNDSIQRPKTYKNSTAHAIFRDFISKHNSQMGNDDHKRIDSYEIKVEDESCYRKYEVVDTTMNRMSDLVESVGGWLRFEGEYQDGAYTTRLIWENDFTDYCGQTINFGWNMLDISKSHTTDGLVTYLVPQGAYVDGKRIGIKSVNENVDYVTEPTAVAKYGVIYGTHVWEDVTTPSKLLNKAKKYLKKICKETVSISVTAIDLSELGYAYDDFHIGTYIQVISKRHGINEQMVCMEQTLDILHPENNKLVLGETQRGYIQSMRSNLDTVANVADNTESRLEDRLCNMKMYEITNSADSIETGKTRNITFAGNVKGVLYITGISNNTQGQWMVATDNSGSVFIAPVVTPNSTAITVTASGTKLSIKNGTSTINLKAYLLLFDGDVEDIT